MIILGVDGFLNKKEKLTIRTFKYILRKLKTTTCGVVTCKRHEAHAGMKSHTGKKDVK